MICALLLLGACRCDSGPAAKPEPTAVVAAGGVQWLVAGGGNTPEFNQLSIEQDLGLAARVFGRYGEGTTLYAAGPETRAVQVELVEPRKQTDDVRDELATLFNPRGGRNAEYRPTTIAPQGAATRDELLKRIRGLSSTPGEPGLVYLAGHGDRGDAPADNVLLTWGGDSVSVRDVAAAIAQPARPMTFVVTSCFSGGFAELVFTDADASQGATDGDVCGFFAATWDLEASGCDPNPDRRKHEGYGPHFLWALEGLGKGGQPAGRKVDLDGDGVVSLSEADAHVRIVGGSIDVPTRTSERWLRHAAPNAALEVDVDMPEDRAVIAELGAKLGVRDVVEVEERLGRVNAQLDKLRTEETDAIAAETAAWRIVTGKLLARWPVLDDPWHPEHARQLEENRDAIGRFLVADPSLRDYERAREHVDKLVAHRDELTIERAPLERLLRAFDNVVFARRLAAAGGAHYEVWKRIVACERRALTAP